MIEGTVLAAAFMTGLVGSTHCIGMCGGLVASVAWQPPRPGAPIQVHVLPSATNAARQLALNAGRLTTYTAVGALAGGISAAGIASGFILPLREILFVTAQLLMILLGIHLTGRRQPLAPLERAGARLWRHIQPFTRRLLPADSPGRAFWLGTAWGWLPCGMVYSMLVTAMAAGTPVAGALVMLVFGLGTLPMLMVLGGAAERVTQFLKSPRARLLAGVVVIAFGVIGLARIPSHGQWATLMALCQRPVGAVGQWLAP